MGNDKSLNAFLGANTSYHGQLTFSGTVHIDGEFTGEIKSEGRLVLGQNSNVNAKVHVAQMEVYGKISGEIVVTKKTEMHKSAFVMGTIVTPALIMEEGAILQGKVQMTKEPLDDEKKIVAIGSAEAHVLPD